MAMVAIMSNNQVTAMYQLYCEGYSLAQVASAYGITRQAVSQAFKRRNFVLRPRARTLPDDWQGHRVQDTGTEHEPGNNS